MPLNSHSTKSYQDYRKAFMESIQEFNKPVESFLGSKTQKVLAKPEKVESYLVFIPDSVFPPKNLDGYLILAQGPNLTSQQIKLVRELIFDPASYYNGSPVFRRLPHVPEFALRWKCEGEILDLLIDLHNPGWDFVCENEWLSNWNWVEDEIIDLAWSLFPDIADPSKEDVWIQDKIKQLITKETG